MLLLLPLMVFLILSVFNLELLNSVLALSRPCGDDCFLLNASSKMGFSLLEDNSGISKSITHSET